MRHFLTSIAFCCAIIMPDIGQADPGKTALLRKINLAAKQRMLSQRVGLTVCLVSTGAEPSLNLDKARGAIDLFRRTLDGLRDGNTDLGLVRENSDHVLDALGRVETLWRLFEGKADHLLANVDLTGGTIDRTALADFRSTAGLVLAEMNRATQIIVSVYAEALTRPELAATLNIAGRQRMLIQKVAMDACFAVSAPDDRDVATSVKETTDLFQTSLAALFLGDQDKGVIKPPTSQVEDALLQVVRMWRWLGPDLGKVTDGQVFTTRDLALLARAADVVLGRMNEAVELYESG